MEDRDSLEKFFREHAHAIHGYLLWATGDRSIADDLTQETFLKAARALGSFRGGSPRAWLMTIARSVRIDAARRIRPPTVPLAEQPDPRASSAIDERVEIQRILMAMPEPQRSALVLRDHVGMSYAEIGTVLARSEGATRVIVHRARKAFRSEYLRNEGVE